MKTWFKIVTQSITVGFIFGGICQAESEQWQPKTSRIEQQPLLIHETRGNWYLKQKYYKEARATYEQIRSELASIEKTETRFRQEVEAHQSVLAKFYHDIGFAQGEVDSTLNQTAQEIQKLREATHQLTEAERKLSADIDLRKQSLEQLKEEFTTVDALSDALSKTMQTLEGKITEAHDLEKKSWKTIEAIAEEINDRKVEQMKLEIETNFKNLQQIGQYLNVSLLPFLETKIQENESHIAAIKDKAEDLRTHGTELSKVINAEEEAVRKKQLEQEKAKAATSKIPEKPEPKPGFFKRAWHSLTSGLKSIGSWFMNLFSSPQPEVKPTKQIVTPQPKH